jgi:tRNA threonylcarbamoyl adenosine modification protein YeaZ
LRLLAFETLGTGVSAAAFAAGTMVDSLAEPDGREQAEHLLPLIDRLRQRLGWAWTSVDVLAVDVGPGGFTAIRTGVAAARALALALDRPIMGVTSLETIAAAAGGPVLALKDLRREQLAVQHFGKDGSPSDPVKLLTRPEAAREAARAPRLAGDGADAIAAETDPAKPVIEAELAARYVGAASWYRMMRGAAPVAGTELRPFYLRAPDARLAAGKPLVAVLAEP